MTERGTRDRALAEETRLWVAVILAILLSEVGMHEFGGFSPLWGSLLAAVMLAAAGTVFVRYGRTRLTRWLAVGLVAAFLAVAILANAYGLEPLPTVRLGALSRLGITSPTTGLLAIAHIVADIAVIVIGVYQVVRWFRLRHAGVGVSGLAAMTGCCGTTAAVLGPFLAGLLGAVGIHTGVSLIMIAALLTAALAALAYVWTEGNLRRIPRQLPITK